MASATEGEQKLECQSIHVGQGKHTEHSVAVMEEVDARKRKVDIAPQIAVSKHHTLGVAHRTGSIVDQRYIR